MVSQYRVAAFCLFVCGMGQGAFAQTAPPENEDVVRVVSAVPETGPNDKAAVQSVLENVPGGTNFSDLREEARLSNFSDALSFLPGLIVQEFSGGSDLPRLNVRGSGIQGNPVNRGVLLRADGVPINDADGSYIIGMLDPNNTKFVTAHRGANSRAFGPATLGGDINFISFTGEDAIVRAQGGLGSFGRESYLAGLGSYEDDWDIALSYNRSDYDGYRRHSASSREAASLGFGLSIGGDFTNRTNISWTDLSFELPFALNKAQAQNDPQSVIGDNDQLGALLGGGQLDPAQLLGDLIAGTIALPSPTALQDPMTVFLEFMLNVYRRDPRREVEQFRAANISNFDLFGIENEVAFFGQRTDDLFVDPLSLAVGEVDSLGGYWQAVYTTQMFDFGFRTGVQRSEFARAYYASEMQDGAQGAIYADLDMEATNALGELTVDMRLGAQWQIGIAAQVMNAKRAIDNRETGDSINQDRWSFTPKAGIIYGRNKMWHAYANVSVSQEMPSFWELAANKTNPLPPQDHQVVLSDLKVQQAITVEAGIAGEWLPGHHGQLTIYRTRLEDELLSTAGSTGLIDDTINYDATSIHQGMELGASGDVRFTSLLGLTYRLSYVFSDFYFSGGEFDGNQIAGVPRNLLNGQLMFGVGGFSVGPTVQWSPDDNPTDHKNTLFQDSYALLGLVAAYRGEGWSVFVQGQNLTDEVYASSYVVRAEAQTIFPTFLPGTGRSFDAGFRIAF
ncbi:MAG: TonB-dependent receptor [Alphaproteobacteria bacterium]